MLTVGARPTHRDNEAAMHLIVPFAGTVSEAGLLAQQSLSLPYLERLLPRLTPCITLGSDAFSPNPPHEQALALAWGWCLDVAALPHIALPFAARQAASLGLPGAHTQAWGQLTPVHLQPGREQIQLTDPASLQLDEAGSRELLAIVQPLFETEGFKLYWAAPLQWLATHELFDQLPSASLDRVIARHLDAWLPTQPQARLLRRLQNEVQMLMYTHTVNDSREAAGLPTVNSVWLSGCGRLPAVNLAANPTLDDRLRAPALGEDWAAWCEAWLALDAGPINTLLHSAGPVQLTLCGERLAQTWASSPQGAWQRFSTLWRKPVAHSVLEAL